MEDGRWLVLLLVMVAFGFGYYSPTALVIWGFDGFRSGSLLMMVVSGFQYPK